MSSSVSVSSVSVQGQELIEGRAFLDACEAKWLVTLVAFNAEAAFELDGHTSTVAWLVDRCGMGRSTAKEKLRVAQELRRRPVIGDATHDHPTPTTFPACGSNPASAVRRVASSSKARTKTWQGQ